MSTTDAETWPVVGRLVPSMLACLYPELDSGYLEYATPTVTGLAKVNGTRLDLLVITARRPGRGDVGRFLAEAMHVYDRVTVWEITNPIMQGMLDRRGFTPVSAPDNGGWSEGVRWTRPGT